MAIRQIRLGAGVIVFIHNRIPKLVIHGIFFENKVLIE